MENDKLSYEYIRGLVAGEGCFTFCGIGRGFKVPAFVISMSKQDRDLIFLIKKTLALRNRIYEYEPRTNAKDSYARQGMTVLIVRDFGQLKNIIVPLFYKKLVGNKAKQFEIWLEKIGTDPAIPESFRFIHRLHKIGFYEKNPKFL